MAQISVRGVSLGYEGKTVVRDLNFTVDRGDYLCIVGENGSGKSTLIKALLRLIPPLAGTIETGGGLSASKIGYLPQQTPVQKDFPASAWEIVLSGCLSRCGLRPFYTGEEKGLAKANMERLGITSLARQCYRELSGGQQQRVLLARALCATRLMLLLDEPAAGLDPKVTGEMYALVEKLNREDGITILMVSHDIPSAIRYASHILHLGVEPPFFGTTPEYLSSGAGRTFAAAMGGEGDA